MAVKSDDSDIRESWFKMEHGGNGDYYMQVYDRDKDGGIRQHAVRISMSGGYSHKHLEFRLAVSNLYRLMEADGLNEREFT